jgi:hypothetical protein
MKHPGHTYGGFIPAISEQGMTSVEEDCFNNDIGNSSKAPTCDLKGLKFEPARQDLEDFMASKENLIKLSAIISRNWSIAIEEDDSYIQIYPHYKSICCCL